MAFLRRKGNSYYLVHNVREHGKVKQLYLAPLGERPRNRSMPPGASCGACCGPMRLSHRDGRFSAVTHWLGLRQLPSIAARPQGSDQLRFFNP